LKIKNFTARWKTIALLVFASFLVVSCTNVRQGISWPALSTLSIDGQTVIAVAFAGQIELLNPENGTDPLVLRDEAGDIALDSEGNVRRWVIQGAAFENVEFYASPLLRESGSEPTLLFPTYNNRMLEFTLDSGQVLDPTGVTLQSGVLAQVAASDDLLYVPYRDGDVQALDSETYEEVWRVETKEGVWATPLLQDGVVYFTSIDHFLYAVDAETGNAVWDQPVDLEGAIASTPLYDDGYLYVGSYSHKMYKVDAVSGEIVAEYEGHNWVWSTPVLMDGVLYYTDLSGYVYALNAADLSERWAERHAEKGIRPAPVVTEDYVVAASRDGKVYWLDRESGSLIFDRELEGRPEILSDILLLEADPEAGVDDALIIVGSADPGRLVGAFVLENSSPLWVYGR